MALMLTAKDTNSSLAFLLNLTYFVRQVWLFPYLKIYSSFCVVKCKKNK